MKRLYGSPTIENDLVTHTLSSLRSLAYRFFASRFAFYTAVGILFLQAAWFAVTVQYPIAFDESYHMGIIQFYSHQWLPFMHTQPPGSEAFGDLTRYGSYMYHYLLSFPYRIIDFFSQNWLAKILIFRFFNIGMFIAAIFLIRRLFQRMHISEALINFSLLMFVLMPLSSFLASTINYDNLALLVAALFLNFTVTCSISIKERGMITAKDFVYFIAAGVFGSLVKFPFMPIFVAGLMYLVVVWWRTKPRKKILAGLVASFKAEQRLKRFVLVGLLVLSIGLFIERYGVNYALYHRQEPRCEQIRSKSECMRYGPWARNYSKIQQVATTNPPYDPPVQYFLPVWTNTLVTRAYFAINHNFETRDPLPLPFYTAIVVGTIGLVLSLVFWRRIIAVDRHMLLLAAVIVLYLCALMQTNFGGYLNFHIIDYGVNGRYLILILPFLFIWLGLGFYFAAQKLFKKHAHSFLVLLSVVVLALTLNGGGWQTFLLRSEPFWFWENTAVREVNSTLKHIISPLVIGSNSK